MKFKNLKYYLDEYRSKSTLDVIGPLFEGGKIFNDPVIYVDGGSRFRGPQQEGFSVGDGDSTNIALDESLNTKKNYSDLSYVLSHLSENFNRINLHGFLGGRRDHELMNLAEIHTFLKAKKQTKLQLDKTVIALSCGQWEEEYHGSFSVFCFEKSDAVISGDVKYRTDSKGLSKLSSHGLSNQATGNIKVSCVQPVFLFFNPST
ncbi:hypothetical protein GW915_06845 [bacterium]|nr:hypothetical protein [bacterium]